MEQLSHATRKLNWIRNSASGGQRCDSERQKRKTASWQENRQSVESSGLQMTSDCMMLEHKSTTETDSKLENKTNVTHWALDICHVMLNEQVGDIHIWHLLNGGNRIGRNKARWTWRYDGCCVDADRGSGWKVYELCFNNKSANPSSILVREFWSHLSLPRN